MQRMGVHRRYGICFQALHTLNTLLFQESILLMKRLLYGITRPGLPESSPHILSTFSVQRMRFGEPRFNNTQIISDDVLYRNIIRPCIQDGLLAPTKTQRESFATYVYVYGKMQAWTSQRHKNAIANYHVRSLSILDAQETYRSTQSVITRMNDSVKPTTDGSDCRWKRSSVPDLLDCFEPTLLKRALQREGNLSHLVFGKDNFPSLQVNSSQGKDPLTEYFRRKGEYMI